MESNRKESRKLNLSVHHNAYTKKYHKKDQRRFALTSLNSIVEAKK